MRMRGGTIRKYKFYCSRYRGEQKISDHNAARKAHLIVFVSLCGLRAK